jgi:hypothetical protein
MSPLPFILHKKTMIKKLKARLFKHKAEQETEYLGTEKI